MTQDSGGVLRFGNFTEDERRKLFGPNSSGVEFARRRQTRRAARLTVEETTDEDDGHRKSVTLSVHSRDVSSQNEALKKLSESTDGETNVSFDAVQEKNVNSPDDLKPNGRLSKISHDNTSSLSKIESAESKKGDSSVASDDVTSSVDSTNRAKSDKKAEMQPKPKPASWAALFVNTPPHAATPRGKVGQLTVPPHSVNYPSSKASSTDFIDMSTEPEVVSVDEDPRAASVADHVSKWEMSNKPIPLIPRGLINKGNLCYINATMQALMCCPPFYNLLKSFDSKTVVDRRPSSTPVIDTLVKFANEFEQGFALPAKQTKRILPQDLRHGAAFEPLYIYSMLHRIKSQLSLRGRQEDAEEFLSCLLDGLHEEMLRLQPLATCSKCTQSESEEPDPVLEAKSDRSSQEHSADEEEEWEEVGPKNKSAVTRSAGFESSPVSKIYGGLLRSSVQMQGSKESVTVEPFFTLKLDIQNSDVWTVKDALEGLASKEALHGFTSSKTGQEVDASKRLTLAQLPPILILHLKRFLYDKQGGCQKLHKEIDYTAELELSREFLAEGLRKRLSVTQRTYKLCAVVYHHGKHATGGHYTCDVYHHGVGGWLRFDDSLLKMVTEQQVLKHVAGRVAYLLYYKRCDLL